MGYTSNTHDQDKFCHHHIGDHSALDTGQGQIAFSPTFSLKMGSQFYIRKYFSNSSPFSVMRFLIYVVQEIQRYPISDIPKTKNQGETDLDIYYEVIY